MTKLPKRSPDSQGQWLHNMSVAPQTVITYEGGQQRSYGKGIVFRMPEFHENLTPARILALLDESATGQGMSSPPAPLPSREQAPCTHGRPADVGSMPAAIPTDAEAEGRLRQRIEAHARTLALPPAAVVLDNYLKGDRVCKDLLSVVTVLAKSSGNVYLRDKQPNLAAIRPGRRVVVLLPPEAVGVTLVGPSAQRATEVTPATGNLP